MEKLVFYSWQNQLPGRTNRNLIEKALIKAAGAVSGDDTIDVEAVIDRDTMGMPGSPDIANTIFEKVAAADIFVADVSIVLRHVPQHDDDEKRASPNPNVLIELGYAARALSWDRVMMVMNTAFGDVEELPFDLRSRRVVKYSIAADEAPDDKKDQRRMLEQTLVEALKMVFTTAPRSDVNLKRTLELLLNEIDANKKRTGRVASKPEDRHLDAAIQLAEQRELDRKRPAIMTALRDLKAATIELQSMDGYGGAANSVMANKYRPAAEAAEQALRDVLKTL